MLAQMSKMDTSAEQIGLGKGVGEKLEFEAMEGHPTVSNF